MSAPYVKNVNVGGNEFDLQDDAARAMISDEYDQEKSYASGKFCIYENKLYKCSAATTGIWDATKWQETSLSEVANELNGKMTDPVKAVVLNLSSTTFAANTYGEATAEVASVVPEGYTALTAIPRHSMNANLVWAMCSYASGTVTARLRNLSSSAVTVAPTVVVLCVK